MKEFLAKPSFLGTSGTLGADMSYLLAVLFTILFLIGWYKGKNHNGNAHHGLTLWGMVAMLIYFTAYYLARRLGVLALEGKEGFGGPEWAYNYVFTPVLTVHILLVTVGILMALYMIVLGFRASVKENGRRILKDDELKVKNKNFYIGILSTLIVFGLLAFVRCHTTRCLIVYVIGFLLIASLFILEKIVEKFLPDGTRRHRLLGKFTMTLYVVILVTSTITYLLLYIIYPAKILEG